MVLEVIIRSYAVPDGELVMNILNDLTSTCTWDGLKLMMTIQNK